MISSLCLSIIFSENRFPLFRIMLWQVSVQFLDCDRDALADTDAHGCERALAAALLHAVNGSHREPRAAHPERMAECYGPAVRIDKIGILLDPKLPQTGYALRCEG